ncbi:hypothetical protein [Cellulomonas sp. Y8]|uniref:hypothetical protein n=1 Tax=Cellulomonas sp. Y8 TaxID=2591145 RepID=UPI003D71C515
MRTADDSFERVDVSAWPVVATETVGVDARVWLRDDDELTWLYKPVTITSDGHRQGEDWAEKAASHLAELIEVPCAQIELARRGSEEGTVALNLRPDTWEMHSGAQLLQARGASGFVPASELRERARRHGDKEGLRRRPGHSLANIRNALTGVQPPPGHSLPESFTAYDALSATSSSTPGSGTAIGTTRTGRSCARSSATRATGCAARTTRRGAWGTT